jgi:hypothetical protein
MRHYFSETCARNEVGWNKALPYMRADTIHTIDGAQLASINDKGIQSIDKRTFSLLNPDAINAMPNNKLQVLQPEVFQAMTPSQVGEYK